MSLDIGYKFYSSIDKLEDEFLGYEVAPNIFIERLFYEAIPEVKVLLRCSDRGESQIHMGKLDYEYDYTSINYSDLDYGYWNSLIHGYLYDFHTKDFSSSVKIAEDFFSSSDVDFETKKFALNKLINEIELCHLELLKVKKQDIDKFQSDLLDVFIEIYGCFIECFKSESFAGFKTIKTTPIRTHKNHFTMSDEIEISTEDLRNSLVAKRFISDKTKHIAFKKAFSSEGISTKINWTGGKDRLASFVSLLKEQKIIKGQPHNVAKNVFTDNGNEIKHLVKPKEYQKYKIELQGVVKNHFKSNLDK